MCGIVGICGENHSVFIEKATEMIAHRGPDGQGTVSFDQISFGHRRLSIVDLSETGAQPMFSKDRRYVLVYNGEIYNHYVFRQALSEKYEFVGTSDTETLLYALIEYGPKILASLNGIFAFCFYDTQTEKVLLARDHFGIKPLYYYQKNGVLMFGSEIKSFLAHPNFDTTIDLEALKNYVQFLWSPNCSTAYTYVKRFPAGSYATIDLTEELDVITPTAFYTVPFEGLYYRNHTETQLIELLEQKLTKAVERQLMADVPIGFFLSGGLDSTAIVFCAKKLRPHERLKCYTIKTNSDFIKKEGFSDDLYYAREVAKHLDLDLIEVEPNFEILKDFDDMVWSLDEPQSDIAPLNVAIICQQARKDGIKVLLGGTAGDDLFSGYRRHQAVQADFLIDLLPKFLIKTLSSIFNQLKVEWSFVRRSKRLIRDFSKDKLSRHIGYFSWMSDEWLTRLFKKTGFEKSKNIQYFKDLLTQIPHEKSRLNQMLFWEMKTFLPNQNLNYTDKMSMKEGIEVRVPFLDLDLVDFACRLPVKYKIKNGHTKYILRKMMEAYIPHHIIYRSKAGFGGPLRTWLYNEFNQEVARLHQDENLKLFDGPSIERMIELDRTGKEDFAYNILSLISISKWMSKFKSIISNNK